MKTNHIISMKCMNCGYEYNVKPDRYVCDKCGVDGILDIIYDYKAINFDKQMLLTTKKHNIWRYKPLLPVSIDSFEPKLHVGLTPIYYLDSFTKKYGINLYIKDDGRNPTGSLKDRASAVAVVKAFESNCNGILAASTGNAASSLAGFAASVNLPAYIVIPKRAPKAKIAQLLIYGAKTIILDANYDQCFEISIKIAEKYNLYNRNCAYNPYCVEGKKTVVYEIWEQLEYDIPDRIYVSIGDGCITSGIYKGFYDLYQLGLIDKIPKIIGVQAEKCNPIEVALKTGCFIPQLPNTIADSIAVGVPRNRLKALRALKCTNGDCISVSDDDIKKALLELPRISGVFAEPAGVTSYAGFLKDLLAGRISSNEKIVVLITGNGLKDIETAISVTQVPEAIKPDLQEIYNYIEKSNN